MIKYSIIIPVYNNKKQLVQCLRTIYNQIDKSTEIIVVDDCSSRKEIESIAKKYTNKLVKLNKNCGAGVARNYGAKIAKGKYLVFIDSDVMVNKFFFKKLINKVDKLPKNYCLQGVYSLWTPKRNLYSQFKNLYYYYNFFYRIHENNFSYLSSHCFIIPRKIFLSVKGFNTKIKTVIEDADLSYRLLRKGYQIKLDRDLVVTHLKNFSLTSLLVNDAKLSFAKAKHILRNFFKNDKEKLIIVSGGRINEMYPVILNVIITPLCVFSIFLFLIIQKLSILFISIFLFFIFVLINFNFFRFVYIKKNFIFLSKLIPLYFLDMFFAFAGIIWGVFDYLIAGRKY